MMFIHTLHVKVIYIKTCKSIKNSHDLYKRLSFVIPSTCITVPKPDYKEKKTINKDQNDAGG